MGSTTSLEAVARLSPSGQQESTIGLGIEPYLKTLHLSGGEVDLLTAGGMSRLEHESISELLVFGLDWAEACVGNGSGARDEVRGEGTDSPVSLLVSR